MAVTAERFNQGMTYEEYKAQMTRNRERFDENEAAVQLDPSDVQTFAGLEQPLNVLVIAEDWCGDVISGLPVLGKLAESSNGNLNVRIFLRDQNLDLMDQYLKEGKYRSIPVFVFLDKDFNDLGHMIERPQSVTEMLAEKRAAIYASDARYGDASTPADQLDPEVRASLMQAINQVREDARPQINSAIIGELRAIIQQNVLVTAE
jgi:thiol-disulfide isomerase/thioredoxin